MAEEVEVVLTEKPPKPLGELKIGQKGPNGKRYKVKKDVLDAWEKERAKVVRENNAKIKKGQEENFGEHLRAHNKMVIAEVFANTAISREHTDRVFGITKVTENAAIEMENKEKSYETKKVIENTAIEKESKKKPLKTEKVLENTTIEKKS